VLPRKIGPVIEQASCHHQVTRDNLCRLERERPKVAADLLVELLAGDVIRNCRTDRPLRTDITTVVAPAAATLITTP
jgi:hypothetical protein